MKLLTCQKGFAPVLLLVLIISAIAIGGFLLYQYKNKAWPVVSTSKISSPKADTLTPQKPDDWQTFKFKYGQISISYPPNWFVKTNDNNGSVNRYIDFIPGKDKSVISGDYIITMRVNTLNDYDRVEKSQLNYSLPGLGQDQNAHFTQQYGITAIRFVKDSIFYELSMDINKSLSQKLDPGEVSTIFIKMAKSLSSLDEKSSCDDPVLRAFTGFPDSLTLLNNHKSTGKDKILNKNYAFEPPYQTIGSSPESTFSADIDYGLIRRFFVSYSKEGSSFQDADFSKKVVPIKGTRNYASEFETEVLNVDCPDKDILNNYYRPYFITEDQNEPFGIPLYGSATNPKELWGQDKWDINLLKKTRNTIYAKRGSTWQKYAANSYQATY